jgi:hypothetical protein
MADKLHSIGESIAGAAAIAAMLFSSPTTRPWHRRWRATGKEVQRHLPGDGLETRVISRQRLDHNPSLRNLLMWRAFTDPISFVMERKMLLGIEERAGR